MNEPPNSEQIKTRLASEIIRLLGDLTDAAASERLGIAEAEVSRLRNGDLREFSIDRLIALLNAFDQHVDVSVHPGASAPTSNNALLALVEEMAAITAQIPPEELDRLPTDFAENLDHYLYGAPKRS